MLNRVIHFSHEAETGETRRTVLEDWVPESIRRSLEEDPQRTIPAMAKDELATAEIERRVRLIPSSHLLLQGDSRELDSVESDSVDLILTSPPYWTLKEYEAGDGQLGAVADYEQFLEALDQVWKHCYRVLVPGGRLIVVVGDVCLPRRRFGRHVVFPLHASIQEHCRKLGFDNLAPIIWHKIANAQLETEGGGGGFLGKPYEPNAVIKNDIEYILFQRKPGGYRQPTPAMRALSVIPEARHREWFQQIWTITGASTREHPAPFPLSLAERLVRMFSFVGDTVLDPFMGTGTTNVAAAHWGRQSIGVEVAPSYYELAVARIDAAASEFRGRASARNLFKLDDDPLGFSRSGSRAKTPQSNGHQEVLFHAFGS